PVAWIGSSDMMHRNLDRRVEVLVKLPAGVNMTAVAELLDMAYSPETKAWELHSDGQWIRNQGTRHLQETLITRQRRRRG
ncbi:MAG: RNA degradosome polyphosphate kinase, partial [Nocardioidaceae bacterium]|nr:RNA degradosome polyphosphate kinase [Nocardioidaceae bacterium]